MAVTSLPNFAEARVLVLGDLMVDEFIYGSCERVSPEAPVPVVLSSREELRPGGAANVALNVASLGAQVALLGVVGADAGGDWLRARMQDEGVACEFVVSASQPTIRKTRVLSRNQQLLRVDREQRYSGHEQQLQQCWHNYLEDYDLLVISDYNKGTAANARELIALAASRGKKVLVDPKRGFEHYAGSWLLTPNMSELRLAGGDFTDEAAMLARARELMQANGVANMLLTRSEQGMTLLSSDGQTRHTPTRAREVFDVTGAGDSVIATLAAALAAGAELELAAEIANAAAGLVVAKVGTASVNADELELAMSKQELDLAIVNTPSLEPLLRDARKRGERIVFTNGCFDIVHSGHVHYLQQARALGDRLVVAVNDDASVRRLKGASRPVNNIEQRLAVLAALRSVDWVLPFAEDTPEALLRSLQPDLLVKGGDYASIEEVVGHEIVLAYGGEVRTLGLVDGVSTTKILAHSNDG